MFNSTQLEIIDQLDPYIDREDGESRKGRSQIYPLIHIKETDTYWCEKTFDVVSVPKDIVGSWIAMILCDEEYYDRWKDVRGLDWQCAKQKEVTIVKWLPQEVDDE